MSYAMWNYLTAPLLFTYPGVESRAIEPWQEDGQTWRRFAVTFPGNLATHNRDQVFYYDADGSSAAWIMCVDSSPRCPVGSDIVPRSCTSHEPTHQTVIGHAVNRPIFTELLATAAV
jgi:hypothetical protein